MKRTLLKYRKNLTSQNGEDGVIEEILNRLKINRGWFCEFGAWDGKKFSNTFALAQKGWNGVMIEGNEDRYKDLVSTVANYPRIIPVQEYVTVSGEKTIDNILSGTPIPSDFDLLSIDIDGFDYHVWQSVQKYHPKIVIIEINSTIPKGIEQIHENEDVFGTSFSSMLNLGKMKGYVLVCHTFNLIFVRADLINLIGLSDSELKNPDGLFIDTFLPKKGIYLLLSKIIEKADNGCKNTIVINSIKHLYSIINPSR